MNTFDYNVSLQARACRYEACAGHLGEKCGNVGGLLGRCILRIAKPSLTLEPRLEKTSVAATEQQIKAVLASCSGKGNEEISDLAEALQ